MSYQYNGPAVTGVITVAGTPGDTDVELGFVPGYIKFTCVSGTQAGAQAEWNDQMADAEALAVTAAGAATIETSNGVTKIPANTAGQSMGFTLGALAGVADTATDVVHYIAFRSAKAN